ncbi:MAG: hypothetical protein GKR89_23150 [Candidatus Latescibacteria bacterium]|nr:hypothetical protein [Candidatus Latescibacterota bacterium]
MAPIRMAQYGTKHGHAGGKLQAMLKNEHVEVAGLYEPDQARRQVLQNSGPYAEVRWYDEEAEMLGDDSIVAIASEGLNNESLVQTEAIVEAGKHVWYDKPAGDDWARWQKVAQRAEEQGLLIQMGFMLRYHEGFQLLDRWTKSGLLGNIFSVRAHMSTNLTLAAREVIAASHDAGIFYDLAGHMLDQVLWLLGRPHTVTSFLRNDSGQVPAFKDNCLGVFEFDRALAFIDIAAMEPKPMARRFEVYGDKGSVIVLEPFEPGQRLRLCLEEAGQGYAAGEQVIELEGNGRQLLYERELEAFLATIAGDQAPDRPMSHEVLVQETLLRATGGISA